MKIIATFFFFVCTQTKCLSQQQTLNQLIINWFATVACQNNSDTIIRPVLVSKNIQGMFNLNDTVVKRHIYGVDSVDLGFKYFNFLFCENKKEFLKKNRKEKFDFSDSFLVVSISLISSNNGIHKVEVLNGCNSFKIFKKKKKCFIFSIDSHALITLGSNEVLSVDFIER